MSCFAGFWNTLTQVKRNTLWSLQQIVQLLLKQLQSVSVFLSLWRMVTNQMMHCHRWKIPSLAVFAISWTITHQFRVWENAFMTRPLPFSVYPSQNFTTKTSPNLSFLLNKTHTMQEIACLSIQLSLISLAVSIHYHG